MRRFKFLLSVCFLMPSLAGVFHLFPMTAVSGQSGGLVVPTGVAASDGAYNNKIGILWDTMRGATRYQV
ncbi:MAG: hypothetical protein ABIU20_02685, partial [Blastocatellia bacterium]